MARRGAAFLSPAPLRMTANGAERPAKEGAQIHPLSDRRWKPISVPERVYWKPGVQPTLMPGTEKLVEANPCLKEALRCVEEGVKETAHLPENMLLDDYLDRRLNRRLLPKLCLLGVLSLSWYSFPTSSRLLLARLIPLQMGCFTAVAGVAGPILALISLAAPPTPNDAVRRSMLLYIVAALAFPFVCLLAVGGSSTGAILMDTVGITMCLGSLFFWEDLNKELNESSYYSKKSKLFALFRKALLSVVAVGVALRALVWNEAKANFVTYHKSLVEKVLKRFSASPALLSDPSATLTLGTILSVVYVLYAMVFCAFITDVGRYPYAREINTPLAISLRRWGILVDSPEPPEELILTDPRGGISPKGIRLIGRPERPGDKERVPKMTYPYLFHQIDMMEAQGKFQGMYKSLPRKTDPTESLKTWAVYAEIPEDESITDSADIVNPATVSEKRIQAILDEARERLEQSRERRHGSQDGMDDGVDGKYVPDEDSVEWLFFDPDDPKNDRPSTKFS
mmetsp:Transcript_2987/g.9150  ORF Transcript_2987/g.9150 Transcript_2987/m.9150 type:complete len:511 (-) Transcript_2987:134-1666(-)